MLSRFWQAEMLGIDIEKLQDELFEERREPVFTSWAEEFERLDYERRLRLARELAVMRNPRP